MASFESARAGRIFQFGGGREAVITAEKAESLISAVAEDDPSHICLSNKSFSSEAASCIAKRLKTFQNIEIADISDIIAGRAEEDALLTLKIICDGIVGNNLIELNVSDNALGSKGVIACKELIICKTLQRLYFCNNGMSADACVLISELLLDKGCAPLTALHFYNNMSGNGGAVAIADITKACPLLQDFRFSATRSSGEGCLAVAKALTSLKSLCKLDLQDNTFSEKAGEQLANSIREQPLLVHLNLRDAGLGEEGTSAVISALKQGKQNLEFLDLSGNDMTAVQAQELAELLLLPHMNGLRELSLDDNELESEGAVFLAKGVRTLSNLVTLSVNTCELTAAGTYVLARSLARLPRFVTLKADGNHLFPEGLEHISTLLLRAGKVLGDMEDNDEDGDEDGFEDALEAGEREEKEGKKESLAFVPDGDIAVSAQLSTYNSEETEEKSEVEITAEGHGPGEGSGEDDLVSAMQSTSISGSHISEMPTP